MRAVTMVVKVGGYGGCADAGSRTVSEARGVPYCNKGNSWGTSWRRVELWSRGDHRGIASEGRCEVGRGQGCLLALAALVLREVSTQRGGTVYGLAAGTGGPSSSAPE